MLQTTDSELSALIAAAQRRTAADATRLDVMKGERAIAQLLATFGSLIRSYVHRNLSKSQRVIDQHEIVERSGLALMSALKTFDVSYSARSLMALWQKFLERAVWFCCSDIRNSKDDPIQEPFEGLLESIPNLDDTNDYLESFSAENLEAIESAVQEPIEKKILVLRSHSYTYPEIGRLLGKTADHVRFLFNRIKARILCNVERPMAPVHVAVEVVAPKPSVPFLSRWKRLATRSIGQIIRPIATRAYSFATTPLEPLMIRKLVLRSTPPVFIYKIGRFMRRKRYHLMMTATMLATLIQPTLVLAADEIKKSTVGYCAGWMCGPVTKFESAPFVTSSESAAFITQPILVAQYVGVIMMAIGALAAIGLASDGRNWVNGVSGAGIAFAILLIFNFVAAYMTGTMTG